MPDLAVAWSWDEDKTALTFQLRQYVRWHDGRPFTPKDVKCTWDLLTGKSSEKLRVNPRKSWYRNLEEVTVDSDNQVTFHLKRPQPFFTALLALLIRKASQNSRTVLSFPSLSFYSRDTSIHSRKTPLPRRFTLFK